MPRVPAGMFVHIVGHVQPRWLDSFEHLWVLMAVMPASSSRTPRAASPHRLHKGFMLGSPLFLFTCRTLTLRVQPGLAQNGNAREKSNIYNTYQVRGQVYRPAYEL